MAMTNKTLSVLLIAAIVVSIGGTFFSLMMLKSPSPTGMATNQDGDVTLTVAELLSINLEDAAIDFGECTPANTQSIFVDSNQAQGAVNNANCTGSSAFPDIMTLANNGNVDANVYITVTKNASDLFGTAGDNGFGYKTFNDSINPGCAGALQTAYVNFTTTGATQYNVCDNLTALNGNNKVGISAAAWLSTQATGGGSDTWTFTAEQVV